MPKPPAPFAHRDHIVGDCCDPPPADPASAALTGPSLSEGPLTHGFDFADLLDPPPEALQECWSAAALLRARCA